MSSEEILIMPGEGVGPEVVSQASRVLDKALALAGVSADITTYEVGEEFYRKTGKHLSDECRLKCQELSESGEGAILFGSVVDEPIGILRKDFDLFANLRPTKAMPSIADRSPLRPEIYKGVDLLIVRELVSGIYYGSKESGTEPEPWASQQMIYSASEARRILRIAFECAKNRRGKLCLVTKRNVIDGIFDIWLREAEAISASFPEVEWTEFLVDNMAMQLVVRPASFDVLVTTNLFGDILSDLAAGLIGSLGVAPSLSRNAAGFALYEGIGGTAPDIAGRGIANPVATILSVAMMMRHTFESEEIACLIEAATERALAATRTQDLALSGRPSVGTIEITDVILREMDSPEVRRQ